MQNTYWGSVIRGAIFSFHMPLFFICSTANYSGVTRTSEILDRAKRGAKRLIIPFGVVVGVLLIYEFLLYQKVLSSSWLKDILYRLVFSSGISLNYYGYNVSAIGMPWFLVALFCGRIIFDYIYIVCKDDSELFRATIILGILGVLLGQYQYMPFSLDIVLAVMPFLYIGYRLRNKKIDLSKWKMLINCFILWIVSLSIETSPSGQWSYLELATRRYPMIPLCYITAVLGTLMVASTGEICIALNRTLALPILYIGKHSMLLYCIHMLDGIWYNLYGAHSNEFLVALIRLLIDITIFIAIKLCSSILRRVVWYASR